MIEKSPGRTLFPHKGVRGEKKKARLQNTVWSLIYASVYFKFPRFYILILLSLMSV